MAQLLRLIVRHYPVCLYQDRDHFFFIPHRTCCLYLLVANGGYHSFWAGLDTTSRVVLSPTELVHTIRSFAVLLSFT